MPPKPILRRRMLSPADELTSAKAGSSSQQLLQPIARSRANGCSHPYRAVVAQGRLLKTESASDGLPNTTFSTAAAIEPKPFEAQATKAKTLPGSNDTTWRFADGHSARRYSRRHPCTSRGAPGFCLCNATELVLATRGSAMRIELLPEQVPRISVLPTGGAVLRCRCHPLQLRRLATRN